MKWGSHVSTDWKMGKIIKSDTKHPPKIKRGQKLCHKITKKEDLTKEYKIFFNFLPVAEGESCFIRHYLRTDGSQGISVELE